MIVLGRITAPYGLHGWVKVHPFGDEPLAWRHMPEWWLGQTAEWQPRKLAGCRSHGSALVARFEGIEDRGAAEALTGMYVAAPREALPANRPGEYYWADLIGLQVVNLVDEPLGCVERLMETGANQVLCVQDGETERLLPFVESVVCEVNLAARRIRVDWQQDW